MSSLLIAGSVRLESKRISSRTSRRRASSSIRSRFQPRSQGERNIAILGGVVQFQRNGRREAVQPANSVLGFLGEAQRALASGVHPGDPPAERVSCAPGGGAAGNTSRCHRGAQPVVVRRDASHASRKDRLRREGQRSSSWIWRASFGREAAGLANLPFRISNFNARPAHGGRHFSAPAAAPLNIVGLRTSGQSPDRYHLAGLLIRTGLSSRKLKCALPRRCESPRGRVSRRPRRPVRR